MSTFISVMLIIILVLIISDVFFLWKIFKNIGKKRKLLPGSEYFELKYNINLLKAVSAILIFLVSFLGFNSYNNISENIDRDFSEKFEKQNKRIDSLTKKLFKYENFLDSLKVEEGEAIKNLNDINSKFINIENKLIKNQEALKYTTKVFAVKDLVLSYEREVQRFYFNKLKTFKNENLPVFKTTPLVVIQSRYSNIRIIKITSNYIELYASSMTIHVDEKTNKKIEFDYFDMWIAEPN